MPLSTPAATQRATKLNTQVMTNRRMLGMLPPVVSLEGKMEMLQRFDHQTADGARPARDHVRIAILGAGFGGLGMAIRLKQDGVDDFVVLERDADVGGTWWANTYPGCQCDIPSHLYSFSFALNPDWSRTYPKQPELREYLRDCARRFGVYQRLRLNCAVESLTWDEEASRWMIETSDGP